jgi:hypothetical protein
VLGRGVPVGPEVAQHLLCLLGLQHRVSAAFVPAESG